VPKYSTADAFWTPIEAVFNTTFTLELAVRLALFRRAADVLKDAYLYFDLFRITNY
jgi:hypothetical protein